MPKVLLALGPIVFRDFELPPEIGFGGKQRTIVHHLPDGRRVIDCLGRDDADIRFSGILAGTDATARAQLLDGLRTSGAIVPLTWDIFFYSVVVTEFTMAYRNDIWIPYTLRCCVLRDESDSLLQLVAPLTQLIMDDLNAAANGQATEDVDFTTPMSAVSAPGATVYGSASHQNALNSLGSVEAILDTGIRQSEQELSGLDFSSGSADGAIAALSSASALSRQLAWQTRAQGFIGRAISNVTGQDGTT